MQIQYSPKQLIFFFHFDYIMIICFRSSKSSERRTRSHHWQLLRRHLNLHLSPPNQLILSLHTKQPQKQVPDNCLIKLVVKLLNQEKSILCLLARQHHLFPLDQLPQLCQLKKYQKRVGLEKMSSLCLLMIFQ